MPSVQSFQSDTTLWFVANLTEETKSLKYVGLKVRFSFGPIAFETIEMYGVEMDVLIRRKFGIVSPVLLSSSLGTAFPHQWLSSDIVRNDTTAMIRGLQHFQEGSGSQS